MLKPRLPVSSDLESDRSCEFILTDAHHTHIQQSLKFLIEDNDEDLYTYFEEYVEMSGEDFSEKDRWTALKKFARRAHEVAARSEYQVPPSSSVCTSAPLLSSRCHLSYRCASAPCTLMRTYAEQNGCRACATQVCQKGRPG